MLVFRWIILVSMFACAALLMLYAFTANEQFKKYGLYLLKISLFIVFIFFAVVIIQRI